MEFVTQPGQIVGQPLPSLPAPTVVCQAKNDIIFQKNGDFSRIELDLDDNRILALRDQSLEFPLDFAKLTANNIKDIVYNFKKLAPPLNIKGLIQTK